MDIVEIFNINASPLVLMVCIATFVFGAIAVFLFGFKKAEPPRINRRSSDAGTQTKGKRKSKRGKLEAAKSPKDKESSEKTESKATKSKAVMAKPAVTTRSVPAAKEMSDTAVASKAAKNGSKKVRGAAAKKADEVSVMPAKRTNKTSDSTVTDGGDWQTVTTKKQKIVNKKSSESLLAPANSKEDVKSAKNKKNKANKTKKATSAENIQQQEPAGETQAEVVCESKVEVAPVDIKTEIPIALFDLPPNKEITPRAEKPNFVDAATETIEGVYDSDEPATNRVVNEDLEWKEATTPKKTKRRALRE